MTLYIVGRDFVDGTLTTTIMKLLRDRQIKEVAEGLKDGVTVRWMLHRPDIVDGAATAPGLGPRLQIGC